MVASYVVAINYIFKKTKINIFSSYTFYKKIDVFFWKNTFLKIQYDLSVPTEKNHSILKIKIHIKYTEINAKEWCKVESLEK